MIPRKPITLLGVAAVPLVALAVAGCGSGSNGATAASPPPKTASAPPQTVARNVAAVRVANNGKLGKILVDSRGRTLYLFTKDAGTTSSCTGACAAAWPALLAHGKPTAGSGAKASLVGTTTRPGGMKQVTYNGHPLYLFVKDQSRGTTNGQGVTAFGGSWFAVSPAGKQASGGAPNKPAAPKKQAAPPKPAAPAAPPKPAAPAPAPAPKSNGIPQNNGGDQDSDNNGGPDDGDGGI